MTMINMFTKLENIQNVTESENKVVQYILTHPDSVMTMSIKELAEACYVSTSAIYRLCDKLDVDGYNDFKIRLSHSLTEYTQRKGNIDYNFPFKENQTQYQVLSSLKENYEQTLLSTFDLFETDEIRKVVSKMQKAKHITEYTSANNIFFAQSFKMQMQEIDVRIEVPIDEYEQRLLASTSGPDDLAIIISYEGRLTNIDLISDLLKINNTAVLLISSGDYQIKNITPNYHIFMPSYEHKYVKLANFSTRLSLLYILDGLYSCYFETDYKNNLEKRIKYAQLSGASKNE